MTRIWRWIVHWWRGLEREFSSTDTQRARARLSSVVQDDARVNRLNERVRRVRRENNLGPQISRALRTRRP